MVKMSLAGAALALVLAAPARADFVNLDFEQAQLPGGSTVPISTLEWSAGAPGWSHTTGSDTGIVYYNAAHVGVTQWFMLVGEHNGWLLEGAYSMAFRSGMSSSFDPNATWVHAALWQTGTVPSTARSLQLRAFGPLAVFLGDTALPLQSLGGNLYGADVQAFAGQTLELRLVNTSNSLSDAVVVDSIVFSPSPVPELPTLALFGLGLAGWAATRRRS